MQKREAMVGFIFVAPWIIGLLSFTIGPLIYSLFVSFCDYNVTTPAKWIGLRNYKTIFTMDARLVKSVSNTLWYTAVNIPISLVGGLVVACMLNTKIPGLRIFRTILYLPSILVGVGVTFLWMLILNPSSGLLNFALSFIGIKGPAWLNDPIWSKPALIIMNIWGFGGQMLLYLARLQSIPVDFYEAADLDGAGSLSKFKNITLPMLTPIIFYNLTLGIIGNLQVMQEGYLFSGDGSGNPASSLLFYNLHLWREAFKSFRMGYASAMAWMLFAVTMIITAINVFGSKKWVYYEGGTNE